MNCGRDSIAVSTKGKYSQDLAETSVKFTSTYPNWESMSFNLTSESTPNRRVFLFGVEHKYRIASIKTHFLKSDLAVDEFESTKGAIELVTPIEGYGYSSIEFSTTQDHDHVNSIYFTISMSNFVIKFFPDRILSEALWR